MKKIKTALIILFFTATLFGQAKDTIRFGVGIPFDPLNLWKLSIGDSINGAKREYDDSGWKIINRRNMALDSTSSGWLRKQIVLHEDVEEPNRILLRLYYVRTKFEVFWDGEPVYSSKNIDLNERLLESQESFANMLLPAKLCTKGSHTIAIRFYDFFPAAGRYGFEAYLQYNGVYHYIGIDWLLAQYFFLGFILACTIIGLVLLWGGKQYRPFIFFTVLCIITLLWKGGMASFQHLNLSLAWIKILFTVQLFAYSVFDIFLFLFMAFQLNISKKTIHITVVSGVNIVFVLLHILNYTLFTAMVYYYSIINLYILGILAYSVMKKTPGGIYMFSGFAFYALLTSAPYISQFVRYTNWEIVSYTVLMIFIILSIRHSMKEKDKRENALKLRTQRLEIELLKKSIQPHFLINTLSALKTLAKKDADKADHFLEAVANELRLFNKISAEYEIPIKTELELCRYHLDIMEFRKEAKYKFHIKDVDLEDKIPPLVFHTLIENSISHAFRPFEEGNIWLACSKSNGNTVYTLENDGSLLSKYIDRENEKIIEGMGINYVKARLEERYSKNWQLDYGYENNLWKVKITIVGK